MLHNSGIRSRKFLIFIICFTAAISSAAQTVPPVLYNSLKWRLIGPFRGGRAVAVAGIPGNATKFYFGAVNGGIWETNDAGVVWRPIFDDQHIASIGAIAVAPSDPNTIYAGTGESDIRSDLSSGDGIYKSTDGGKTWANVGLRDTRQISRVVVDTQNANIAYVAALGHAYGRNPDRGVYKTEDGGAHWNKVLYVAPDVGAASIAIAADNPKILFASMWNGHRPPWSTYAPIGGPDSGLYRSTDSGKTWTHLTGSGLPDGDWGRSGVAVSRDGRRVYLLVDAKKAGLYRSDDGGNNWTLENSDSRLTGRSWYFCDITIDPNHPDVLYIPNVALYRTDDGGKTIAIVRGAPGGDDYHELWVDPTDSTRMILGSDQGTTISVNHGETWSTWYNQPTAQIYHVATDNRFPYAVYGPQQDSGGMAVMSRNDYGELSVRDTYSPGGSESGYIAPDPNDPNILYSTGAFGSVTRFDLRTSLSQNITPWPVFAWGSEINARKYRDGWNPVLLFSPHDNKTLYFGTQFVMKTIDGGLHWETISPDLTGASSRPNDTPPNSPATVDNTIERGYGLVNTIAPSSLKSDLIWVGSDTGFIHLTQDGGKTWKDVTPKGLAPWSRISWIETSHFDPAEAYAAIDRHRMDDLQPYLYRTRDSGATWQQISNGINAPSFARVVREDPKTKNLLFAGTELGIYVSFDDGNQWQSLQLNLPVTSVQDLVIHGDDLVVATHGRSFWILDDITPLRQADALTKNATAMLYSPAVAVRVDHDAFLETPLPPDEPTAKNPPNGAILDYYLPDSAKRILLEISDSQGNSVRHFSSDESKPIRRVPLPIADRWFPEPQVLETAPGMHRFVWDLASGSSGSDANEDDMNEGFGAPDGPRVVPGTYRVKLTVDGKTSTADLKIVMDPRSSATSAVLTSQYALGRQIFAESMLSRQAIAEINSVQKQLTDAEQKLGETNPDLKTSLAKSQDDIKKILSASNPPWGDTMGLQTANSGVTAALSVVENGTRPAPSQAITVFEEADRALKLRIAEWHEMKTNRLPQLNEQLKQAHVSPITVSQIEEEVEYLMTR